jgi:catechol-2,3-dioxygenase
MEMRSPTDGFAELTLETDDLAGLERFYVEAFGRHVHFAFSAAPGGLDRLRAELAARGAPVRGPEEQEGGDRSLYVEDPAGNIVEVWDFFTRRPIEALAE